MTIFEILIWIGAAITFAGLGLLVSCIIRIARAKSRGLEDDQMHALLRKIVPLNLGAVLLATIGLMLVIVGIFLG